MAAAEYYRGGTTMKPRPGELKRDFVIGMLKTTHGISVWDRPDGLARFGGAFRLSGLPPELRIIQRGKDPHHFEIVPAYPMPQAEYEDALDQVALAPV
jgi:hypothetical protein